MITGAYVLYLYCDNQGTKWNHEAGEGIDEFGHVFQEFPHEYIGEHGSNCRARARKSGWKIHKNGSALCPKCARRNHR